MRKNEYIEPIFIPETLATDAGKVEIIADGSLVRIAFVSTHDGVDVVVDKLVVPIGAIERIRNKVRSVTDAGAIAQHNRIKQQTVSAH